MDSLLIGAKVSNENFKSIQSSDPVIGVRNINTSLSPNT